MIKNTFDLEQQIMDCWHVADELKLLSEQSDLDGVSREDLSQILLGLSKLYQMKFNKLFCEFEKMLEENRNHAN